MGGFQVRPEELTAAGQCAAAIAARLPGQTERLTPVGATAATRLSGWRTAAALRACGDSWRSLLATLAGELETQGQRLSTTGQQYRDGEASALDAFGVPSAPSGLRQATDPFRTGPRPVGR